MSNKTILQSNNDALSTNNLELQNLIELANNLPESQLQKTYTLTVPSHGDGSIKITLSDGTSKTVSMSSGGSETFLLSAGEKIIIQYPMSPIFSTMEKFGSITYLQGESGTKYENSYSGNGCKDIIIMPAENCTVNYRENLSDLNLTTYTITINNYNPSEQCYYYYHQMRRKWIQIDSTTFSIIPGSIIAIHQKAPDGYTNDGISTIDQYAVTDAELLYSFQDQADHNFLRCIYLPKNNATFEYLG